MVEPASAAPRKAPERRAAEHAKARFDVATSDPIVKRRVPTTEINAGLALGGTGYALWGHALPPVVQTGLGAVLAAGTAFTASVSAVRKWRQKKAERRNADQRQG